MIVLRACARLACIGFVERVSSCTAFDGAVNLVRLGVGRVSGAEHK